MDAVEFILKENQLKINIDLPDDMQCPVQRQWQIVNQGKKPESLGQPSKGERERAQSRKIKPLGNFDNRVVDFLTSLPNIRHDRAIEAFILGVGLDKKLEGQLPPYNYNCSIFFTLLLDIFRSFGPLTNGRDPLEAILEHAKTKVGPERKDEADLLIEELHKINYYNENRDFARDSRVPDES